MITVIAGVNGAGKSSIFGSHIRQNGGEYFNPDEVTQQIIKNEPALGATDANSRAWTMGRDFLAQAIALDLDHTFETTLGGKTITRMLLEAIDRGVEVRVLYCGLATAELHIKRVRQRVKRGGHDIPSDKIRARWDSSIGNLFLLGAQCSALTLFDNSKPFANDLPSARRLLSFMHGKSNTFISTDMPEWAKPVASLIMSRDLSEG